MIFLTNKTAGLLKDGLAANGRKRPASRHRKRTRSTPTESMWIELIEEDPDNVGRYSWKKVTPVDGEFVDTEPLIESGEEVYSAREINETTGLPEGTIVEAKFAGYDTTNANQPIYLFGFGGAPAVQRLAVTAIENDYLECKAIDENGDPAGDMIRVAKPWELRHAAKFYQGVNSISTVTAQSVDAADSSITERWEVRPPYLLGGGSPAKDRTIILAASVDKTGVTYEDEEEEEHEITMIDINIAGRVWGLKYT